MIKVNNFHNSTIIQEISVEKKLKNNTTKYSLDSFFYKKIKKIKITFFISTYYLLGRSFFFS